MKLNELEDFPELGNTIVIDGIEYVKKREPLSDDEMRAIWKEGIRGEIPFVEIGRAIEKAHGIGGG